jgi:hypothetical protein
MKPTAPLRCNLSEIAPDPPLVRVSVPPGDALLLNMKLPGPPGHDELFFMTPHFAMNKQHSRRRARPTKSQMF